MSGWKRENGVSVLVLARFRGLEGVRIITSRDVFPSLKIWKVAFFIEQASLCTAAPVCGDLGGHVYNFARNDWPEQLRFYYGT